MTHLHNIPVYANLMIAQDVKDILFKNYKVLVCIAN